MNILNASLLVSFLSLTGCFQGDPLEPLPEDAQILAFGDSLTEGKGVSKADSYPAVLARLGDFSVVNAGVSGELSKDGARRLPPLLAKHQPDLLLLMHGGNDILQNVKPEIAKANLVSMVESAKELRIPVILIGIPEKSLFSKTAPLYRELAEEYELVLEDSIIASLLRNPRMKSDSVHFNQSGYQAIAERILSLMDDEGAI